MRTIGDEGPSGPPTPTPIKPPPPTRSIAKKRTPTVSRSHSNYSGGGSHHSSYSSSSNNRSNYRQQSYQRRGSYDSSSSSGNSSRKTPVAPPKSNTKVIKPVAPPPPKPPSIANSLRADSTYQRQMAAYAKALVDFNSQQGLSKSDYNTNYQNTRRDIGLAKDQASQDLMNDYAARGMLKSSLYSTDLGKLTQQYQNQYNDLDQQRTAFLAGLANQLGSFSSEQNVQKQNAMQEALRRRAEQYNL